MNSTKETKIALIAHSNSSRNCLEMTDRGLEVWVTVPAVDGKANRKIIEIVAKYFKVSKSDVCIRLGQSSNKKVLALRGVSDELLGQRNI